MRATAEARLATCRGELAACRLMRVTGGADLATCRGELAACRLMRVTMEAELASTSARAEARAAELATTTAQLQQLERDLAACRGDLLREQERRAQSLKRIQEVLRCPVSHEICRDPVVASDGLTYQREAISPWLGSRGTSPMTREPLRRLLVPNQLGRALLAQLEEEGLEASDDEEEPEERVEVAGRDPCQLTRLILNRERGPALEMLKSFRSLTEVGLRQQSSSGHTLLHVAIKKKMPDVALAIIAHPQFDLINERLRSGATALHLAARWGMMEVCKAIVQRNDFTQILAEDGAPDMTALRVALMRNLTPLAQFLREAEAAHRARFGDGPAEDG